MATERRSSFRWAFGVVAGFFLGLTAMAGPTAPSEYDVKAAFLFNFGVFVTWPPEAFPSPDAPIIIGVLGDDPFGGDLARLAPGMRVQGRPVSVRRGTTAAQLADCHIVFVSGVERARVRQIAETLRELGSSALTVGESEGFLEAGGMIRFVIRQNKVRFEIQPEAAARAGLTISSKLLSLAINSRRT